MTVLIIGGGASGMAAALTAARAGHQVVLAERQARVGRKLLATGNGRCNLTNENARPDRYHGEDPDFCRFALEEPELSAAGTLAFFRRLGLVTVTESGGRVYPLSNAAASVLDVLRFALEQQENIRVRTGCVIRQLKRREGQFLARTEEGDTITAQRCILAAGGAAGGKLGGGMDGYQLARQLGHHRTALYPSLVQVCTDPTYPRGLKGVKAQAALTLTREGETLTAGQGEVLFTEYGVSGPAVFDLSRRISTGGDGIALHLDFLPGWSREDTLTWLHSRRTALSRQEAGALLTGSVHPRLGRVLCKAAGINGGAAISEVTDRQLEALCRRVHRAESEEEQDPAKELGTLTSGDFVLDENRRVLLKAGQPIELTQVEFQIMELFFRNPGIALVREKILKGVWGENYFGDVKIVDVNIRRLRMKVEDEPSHPTHIMTVWGYGYRWEE